MLELIKAEPNGELGKAYQRYVRAALMPGVRLVVEVLRLHGATIGATLVVNVRACSCGVVWLRAVRALHNQRMPCRVAVADLAEGEVPRASEH